MNKLYIIFTSLLLLTTFLSGFAQQADSAVFKFAACNNMFLLHDNETELERLYNFVEQHRPKIASGQMPVCVEGYCASFADRRNNLKTAKTRSNRIKSELITNKGLREENFITKNYAADYKGNKDMVIVTLRIPVTEKEENRMPEHKCEEQPITTIQKPVAKIATEPESVYETQQDSKPDDKESDIKKERCLAVKTNFSAWAGAVMNAAVDVQVSNRLSIELPVLWSPWKISDSRSIKTFAFQPEVRWWLMQPGEGHFFGLHTHIAWYNARWKNDRYQDAGRPLLGAGISYGYLLPLGSRWAGEFTLGAGYANTRYNTYYNMYNGARIDTRTRNYWGITRVGISLAYRFNSNK